MADNGRPNPLMAALGKAGTALSGLGGVVTYFVTSGIVSASQGEALTAAGVDAQVTVSHIAGVVAGVLAIIAGLSAAFGTAQVAKQDTTPTRDPRNDAGVPLVPAVPGPVADAGTDPVL